MYYLAIINKSKLSVISLCICNSRQLFNVFSVILNLTDVNRLFSAEKVRSEVDELIGNGIGIGTLLGDVQMITCLDMTCS